MAGQDPMGEVLSRRLLCNRQIIILSLLLRGLALPLGFNWMQILFGMKTQFATSIWTTTPGTKSGVVTAEDVGLALQLIFLVVGIVLIEFYLKKQSKLVTDT